MVSRSATVALLISVFAPPLAPALAQGSSGPPAVPQRIIQPPPRELTIMPAPTQPLPGIVDPLKGVPQMPGAVDPSILDAPRKN